MSMTSVNVASLFESSQFWEIAIETFENMPDEYVEELNERIFNLHSLEGNSNNFDFNEIKKMNMENNHTNKKGLEVNKSVFDLETLDHMQKIKDKFFKS